MNSLHWLHAALAVATCCVANAQYLAGKWRAGPDLMALRTLHHYLLLNEFRNGTWYARDSGFGNADDRVLVGDWDGDGDDELAVRRGQCVLLQNDAVANVHTQTVCFGSATDQLLVGDWDGDGDDELAYRRGREVHLQRQIGDAWPAAVASFGNTGDQMFAGDWDGDGADELCVRRGHTVYFQRELTDAYSVVHFGFGNDDDEMLVGDWDGDGDDELAVRRESVFHQQPTFTNLHAVNLFQFPSRAAMFVHSEGARRTPHLQQVPHLDRNGNTRLHFDKRSSVFHIGLYHALNYLEASAPEGPGTPTPLDLIAAAGFTYVHTNQDINGSYLDRLLSHGLRLVKSEARPGHAAAFSLHNALLGWDVFDEPEADGDFGAYQTRINTFLDLAAGIRRHDPRRPIFVNTTFWIQEPNRPWWLQWHQLGNLSCHDNYPLEHHQRTGSFALPGGIAETVQLAASVATATKPVWAILQAFGEPSGSRFAYPTPAELRAMAFVAIVNGATGCCWFSFDNALLRSGAWGISPTPAPRYGATPQIIASPVMLQSIVAGWKTIADLNNRIHRVEPYLLRPTSSRAYEVSVRGSSIARTPVQALMKEYDGCCILLTVNADATPLDIEIQLPPTLATEVRETANAVSRTLPITSGRLSDHLEPHAIRIYEWSR